MSDTEQLKAEAIAEIQARVDAATSGPWRSLDLPVTEKSWCSRHDGGDYGNQICICMNDTEVAQAEQDADFIAHARTDIPWLLKALSDAETHRVTLEQLRLAGEQKLASTQAQLVEANRKLAALEERAEKSMPELGQSLSNARKHRALTAEHALAEANRKLEAIRELADDNRGQWNPGFDKAITFDQGVGALAWDVLALLGPVPVVLDTKARCLELTPYTIAKPLRCTLPVGHDGRHSWSVLDTKEPNK